jgi:short subunit dehydrogenase-like uncharacterized protein
MRDSFLLYGANGYVGEGTARLAVAQGLRPILAGRNAAGVRALADVLGCESRVFSLDDRPALETALADVPLVLHLAGPFAYTYAPMLGACLRAGVHYLDINGELPVLDAIAARDADAQERGVMLMPAVGFDVVPTDCLAVHLQRRLPSASRLAIAFYQEGDAGAPPGTQRTALEIARGGVLARRDGRLVSASSRTGGLTVDFGDGPRRVQRLTWGDLVTAHHSTGIPNIDTFAAGPKSLRLQMAALNAMRGLLRFAVVRRLLTKGIRPPPTPEQRARSRMHVWGEVSDQQGKRASARLHGPEAGLHWTVAAALSVVRRVLAGEAPPGFQTPAGAYGPDLVLDVDGVEREDLV